MSSLLRRAGRCRSRRCSHPARQRRTVCAGWQHYQAPREEAESRILHHTKAPALVDSSGVGDPIVERLQRESSRFTGFRSTSLSKQQLMDGLCAALQRREVRSPQGPIREALDSFEYEYSQRGGRYTAGHGTHDDCVVELVLAVQQLGNRLIPRGVVITRRGTTGLDRGRGWIRSGSRGSRGGSRRLSDRWVDREGKPIRRKPWIARSQMLRDRMLQATRGDCSRAPYVA